MNTAEAAQTPKNDDIAPLIELAKRYVGGLDPDRTEGLS
jgi:hypothetical protein